MLGSLLNVIHWLIFIASIMIFGLGVFGAVTFTNQAQEQGAWMIIIAMLALPIANVLLWIIRGHWKTFPWSRR